MNGPTRPARDFKRARLLLAVFAAVIVVGCSSSSKTKASAPVSGSTSSSSTAAGHDTAAFTVGASDVPGVGTVLVNGKGRTLYVLSSERGGVITCTDDNGCTKVWPATELPTGTTQGIASTGAQAALLGTAKGSSGDLYLTYGGYPLYTFTGDSGAGQASGEGIMSFGGTWSAISPAGLPVNPTASGSTSTSSAPAVAPTSAPPDTSSATDTAPSTTAPPDTAPPTTATTTTKPPPTTVCLYPPCY